MHAKLLFILLFSLVLTKQGFSQNYISAPEGELSLLTDKELLPHEQNGSYYNEHWLYHITLNNGAEVYLNYSINHFGRLRDAVSTARFSLINWEGQNYSAVREYDLEKLMITEDPVMVNLNTERGIWFEGKLSENHKIHFRTQKNGVHFDVNLGFEPVSNGFRKGDGKYHVGEDDELVLLNPIPGSPVNGFVALDYDTVEVTGKGSLIQVYQTNLGTRLFDRSIRYGSRTNDQNFGGFFIIPSDAPDEVIGYGYEEVNGEIIIKKPVSLTNQIEGESSGDQLSGNLKICYVEHPCDLIEMRKTFEKKEMLEEMGRFKRMIVKSFLGGNIVEFRGEALLNDKTEVFFNLRKLD